MQTAKKDVEKMLQSMPDNSSLEDIQYHLHVLEKIRKGQDDLANGCSATHEEAKERLKKWLAP
jgi:predicted transcriptional regulator